MERTDDLQVKNLKIIQDTELFCFGTDAVLLAHYPKIKKNAKVADLGCGSGILMLLMYSAQPFAEYCGIEIQPSLYSLAQRNIKLNNLQKNLCVKCGNIKEAREILGTNYDVVVANPPYEKFNEGKPRENPSHLIARKEVEITFGELAQYACKILKEGGHFCIIHKTCRLSEIIYTLKENKLEPKRLRFVHSAINKPGGYVLIDSVKGGREYLVTEPPLIMYENGTESKEIRQIYGKTDENG